MAGEAPGGLAVRERTRRAVRAELMTVALDLFVRKGYDATTIEEIAAAAGMSRRSIFRYFASKDEVVLGHLDLLGESVAEALAARPGDEDAWTALRRAFDVLLAAQTRDPERSLVLGRMLEDNPALRAHNLGKQCQWHELLAPQVAARLDPAPADADTSAAVDASGADGPGVDGPGADARSTAVIGAALACMEAASRAWLASEGRRPLDRLLDDVMRTVHPGAF